MTCLVVIPTVTGREDYLERCVNAYNATAGKVGIWIEYNRSTCGEAWNRGAKVARNYEFEYVHMAADDLVPREGWYTAAVNTIVKSGNLLLPGALIYEPDGAILTYGNQPQDDWTPVNGASVPFCRTEDWVDIPNIHYYSDNAFDTAQQVVNKKSFVARKEYAFTHHTAQPGRKELTDRERVIYEEWANKL